MAGKDFDEKVAVDWRDLDRANTRIAELERLLTVECSRNDELLSRNKEQAERIAELEGVIRGLQDVIAGRVTPLKEIRKNFPAQALLHPTPFEDYDPNDDI